MKSEKLEALIEVLAIVEQTKRRAARHENKAEDKDDQLFWEGNKIALIGVEEYLRNRVQQEYKRLEASQSADVIPLKKKAPVSKAN